MKRQLISIALLAAAIAADLMGLPHVSTLLSAVFATLVGVTALQCAALLVCHPEPWTLDAVRAMRAVKPIPGKAVGQGLALAAMGWWVTLAAYLLAVTLAAAVERLETGENQ